MIFPQRELADKQMKYYGAMIAMELRKGGYEAGKKFINSTKLWTLAVSLGDGNLLFSTLHLTHSAQR